ncbi:MAG: hypothetical protein WA947_09725 [Phormidesmis sp.]
MLEKLAVQLELSAAIAIASTKLSAQTAASARDKKRRCCTNKARCSALGIDKTAVPPIQQFKPMDRALAVTMPSS